MSEFICRPSANNLLTLSGLAAGFKKNISKLLKSIS